MSSYNNGGDASYGASYEGSGANYIYDPDTVHQTRDTGLRKRSNPVHGAPDTNSAPPPSPVPSTVVKRLDFMFPKVDREYRVQTEKGGLTTMIAILTIALLCLGEVVSWISENASTNEHIVVNTELNRRMRINMNITFPALACEDLHVDAMDVAGDSQLDVEDTLVKKQLRADGSVRSAEEIKVETNRHRQEQENKEKVLKEKLPDDYCGPCFGAQQEEGQCCQTCDELLEAYKKKRWKQDLLIYTAEQCIREGRDRREPKRMTKGEGCNLAGYMTVNRVAGNFHIAMGEGVERDGRHIHTFLPEDSPNFNASHIIHQLSFGPGEEENAPMNGIRKIVGPEHGMTGLFQYFIKVVPTVYKGEDLIPQSAKNAQALPSLFVEVENSADKPYALETNRYFFTERFRPLVKEYIQPEHMENDGDTAAVDAGHSHTNKDSHHAARNSVLPGVFFIYEIYPFSVEISRNSVPLTHLLIRLVAIIGGVFTCASWLDSALTVSEPRRRRSMVM